MPVRDRKKGLIDIPLKKAESFDGSLQVSDPNGPSRQFYATDLPLIKQPVKELIVPVRK